MKNSKHKIKKRCKLIKYWISVKHSKIKSVVMNVKSNKFDVLWGKLDYKWNRFWILTDIKYGKYDTPFMISAVLMKFLVIHWLTIKYDFF